MGKPGTLLMQYKVSGKYVCHFTTSHKKAGWESLLGVFLRKTIISKMSSTSIKDAE